MLRKFGAEKEYRKNNILTTIVTTSIRKIISANYFLQVGAGQLPRKIPSELIGISRPFSLPVLRKTEPQITGPKFRN